MNNRRNNVPFDPYFFEKKVSDGINLPVDETFRYIYQTNLWCGSDSVSGAGASRNQTIIIETELPILLKKLQVDVFLDLPCGDFSWMQFVNLLPSYYIGADILPEIIEENHKLYANKSRQFLQLDLINEPLPNADLLLCRDCFVHLSISHIFAAINNIKRSKIKYLLTTTFPNCDYNQEIVTGDWRLINLEKPPFNFPPPLQLVNEQCSEGDNLYQDKSLGLWQVRDIP